MAPADAIALDMRATCGYTNHMSTMVQIRNMPDEIHRTLKSRAALAGMSLSDYLLQEVKKVAEMPTMEEMRARLARLPAVTLPESNVDILREERDRRDMEMLDRR